MTTTLTPFTARRAPCGRDWGGDQRVYEDGQGLVVDLLVFTCGCRISREEYHDGSFERRIVRHDGRVLLDEEFRGE